MIEIVGMGLDSVFIDTSVLNSEPLPHHIIIDELEKFPILPHETAKLRPTRFNAANSDNLYCNHAGNTLVFSKGMIKRIPAKSRLFVEHTCFGCNILFSFLPKNLQREAHGLCVANKTLGGG
jgi:hypothetical protein